MAGVSCFGREKFRLPRLPDALKTVITMDKTSLEYTRDHYNRHANQFSSTQDALKARATGPGAPLKKFHNEIKRHLITKFAGGAGRLLDLACGRGGDIWKWIDSGIGYVKGVDLSPGEIEEARKRFEEARGKRPGVALRAEFVDSPALGAEEWREAAPYDAVTCMFALHYFFVTEAALTRFLQNVALNLAEGGYFFGTVPDGRRVNECIRAAKRFKSPMLTIEAHWQGAPQCFGSPYICAIGDTVTGDEQGTQGSFEYLVYSSTLVGVAAKVGLKPVLAYACPPLERLLESADEGKPLKHFAPNFPGSDPSLAKASRLFATFVFQKTSGEAAPPLPPLQQQAQQAAQAAQQAALRAAAGKRLREAEQAAGPSGAAGAAGGQAAEDPDGQDAAAGQAAQPKPAAAVAAPMYKRPKLRQKPPAAKDPPSSHPPAEDPPAG